MAKLETNLDAIKAVAFEATRNKTTITGYNSMKRVCKFFRLNKQETAEFLYYMEYRNCVEVLKDRQVS